MLKPTSPAPEDAKAYITRGRIYLIWDEYDRAIKDYEATIKIEPKNAVAYYKRGNAYSRKDDYDLAIADYNEAIKLEPNETCGVYNDRGTAYFQKDDYDLAIADYNEAIKLSPEFPLGYINRGRTYHMKGNYDLAIADYNEAIKLDEAMTPNKKASPKIYYFRADAYIAKGDRDKGIADYNQAIWISPNDPMSYLKRGGFYHAMGDLTGDYARAVEDYDNTVRLCPNYKTYFIDRKFLFGGEYSADRATELLDWVVDEYSDSGNMAAAAYYSGVSILFSGNRPKARRRFETARNLGFKDDNKIIEHLENLKS